MKEMKQIEVNRMRLLAGACGLITVLALAPMSVAQQAASAAGKISAARAESNSVASPTASTGLAAIAAARPVEEEESAAPDSANHQGIKVHGHWVLQVKNADGTLGERREFDNSLVTGKGSIGGDQVLAALISGNATAGDPAVVFYPSVPASGTDLSALCNSNSYNTTCYLLTTAASGLAVGGGPFQYASTGLTTTTTMNPVVSWVLAGNHTIPSGLTSIALVQTIYTMCLPQGDPLLNLAKSNVLGGSSTTRTADFSPVACANANSGLVGNLPNQDEQQWGTLTSTVVPGGALAVVPGQVVQVTVTISFS
jgi:hypothetical protein